MSKKVVAGVEIDLPPIQEQRRIAAVLDAADALRAKRRQALATLDEFPRAPFHEMFGDPIRNERRWPRVLMGELAELRSGVGFPKSFQGRADGDLPFAKVGDISAVARAGEMDIVGAANYVTTDDLRPLRAKPFPPGTIAFAKIGEAIRKNYRVVARVPILFDNNVMGAIPGERVAHRYFFQFLATLDLFGLAQSTAVPSLRKTELARIEVPLPPLDLQMRFDDMVRAVQQHRVALAAHSSALDTLFASLQQRAFRGEL